MLSRTTALVVVLLPAFAAAQTQVNTTGRAFDAPGSNNSGGNPLSASGIDPQLSPLNINPVVDLQTLSSVNVVDPTSPRSLNSQLADPFRTSSSAISFPTTGFFTGGTVPSTAFSLPAQSLPAISFDPPPLPSVDTQFRAPSVDPGLPRGLSGRPSLTPRDYSGPLSPLPDNPLRGLTTDVDGRLSALLSFEEEVIGNSLLFGPPRIGEMPTSDFGPGNQVALPTRLRTRLDAPLRTHNPYQAADLGGFEPNFGSTPAGINALPGFRPTNRPRTMLDMDIDLPPIDYDFPSATGAPGAKGAGSVTTPDASEQAERVMQEVDQFLERLRREAGAGDDDEFGLQRPRRATRLADVGPTARVRQGPPEMNTDLPEFAPSGDDVFRQMSLAVDWINHLRAERKRIGETGEKTASVAASYKQAMSFVRGTQEQPLNTLAGTSSHPAERFARTAEDLMRKGEYYRAHANYDVALVADRENPLLYLGQGHAMIGAGEYFIAVRKIVQGLERFPEVGYFKFDLNEFITDADLLDRRRADLETRLASHEDYRYRFLLGYIEYYTGLEAFGLKNLKRAAENAPRDSIIARFAGILENAAEMRFDREGDGDER